MSDGTKEWMYLCAVKNYSQGLSQWQQTPDIHWLSLVNSYIYQGEVHGEFAASKTFPTAAELWVCAICSQMLKLCAVKWMPGWLEKLCEDMDSEGMVDTQRSG